MKKVKYKTTDGFADLDIGTVIDAWLICQGTDGIDLLLHPINQKDQFTCGSFEFCKLDHRNLEEEIYISAKKNWINLSNKENKKMEKLLFKKPSKRTYDAAELELAVLEKKIEKIKKILK